MKKEEIIILDDRGLISITGDDAKEYLENFFEKLINWEFVESNLD